MSKYDGIRVLVTTPVSTTLPVAQSEEPVRAGAPSRQRGRGLWRWVAGLALVGALALGGAVGAEPFGSASDFAVRAIGTDYLAEYRSAQPTALDKLLELLTGSAQSA